MTSDLTVASGSNMAALKVCQGHCCDVGLLTRVAAYLVLCCFKLRLQLSCCHALIR
jgi:hypothetical protein